MKPRPPFLTEPNVTSVRVEPIVGDRIRYDITITTPRAEQHFILDAAGMAQLLDQCTGAITLALMPKGELAA